MQFKIACFSAYFKACFKLFYCYKSKMKIETTFYENKRLTYKRTFAANNAPIKVFKPI